MSGGQRKATDTDWVTRPAECYDVSCCFHCCSNYCYFSRWRFYIQLGAACYKDLHPLELEVRLVPISAPGQD